ncbi:MAG: S-layer homology domain-containing protein, partial [Coprothermobacterota bacterium]|nr:S-layer homology domain-containing protein [Coprothermobacterota bacterium]
MRNWFIGILLVFALVLCSATVWADDTPPPPPPPDTTPPVSAITEPANNVTVTTNPVIVLGTASANNKQITKVELVVVGPTGTATSLCTPLQPDWSRWEYRLTNPTNGSYTLHPLATDNLLIQQEVWQTIQITVNVQNITILDTTPPVLILLDPATTQSGTFYSGIRQIFTIRGQTEIGATVTINGNPVTVDPSGNFELAVTTSETPQTFSIVATDAANNKSTLTIILSSVWPSSTPTPTPTPSESPTPTPTASPSESPSPTPTSPPGELRDLGGHWAQQIILAMVAKKIITGYPDGTFQPDRTITRAEFCTILAKALNVSPETNPSGFADVTGHWAQGSIAAMVRKGYLKGYPDGSFGPDQP